MLALYIWSTVLGGGMVVVSLLSSISSHGAGDDGDHDGDHDHGDAGHDHDADAGGADHHVDHEVAVADTDGDVGSADGGDADGDAHGEGDSDHDSADEGHHHHEGHAGSDVAAGGHAGAGTGAGGQMVLADKTAPTSGSDLGFLGFLRFVRPTSHFLTGFGLTGLLAVAAGMGDPVTAAAAATTGLVTTVIGSKISKLRTHMTTSAIGDEDLLGREGEVVIRVGPGDAAGKVRVRIKGSAPEFVAYAARPEEVLATGEKVFVIDQQGDGTLRVDRKL